MAIEAKVKTITWKENGNYCSITMAVAYGENLEELKYAAEMAKGVAEGHAKGHSESLALEEISRWRMLPQYEIRKILEK